jgi:hypothetical protein
MGCMTRVPLLVVTALLAALVAGWSGKSPGPLATVPAVDGTILANAYQRLEAAGFRVGVRAPFMLDAHDEIGAFTQSLRAGTRAPRGATVWISAKRMSHFELAVISGSRPTKAPDLVGKPADRVEAWIARTRGASYAIHAPALRPSSRPHLLDNYRVARQTPGPGTLMGPDPAGLLTPGIGVWLTQA